MKIYKNFESCENIDCICGAFYCTDSNNPDKHFVFFDICSNWVNNEPECPDGYIKNF